MLQALTLDEFKELAIHAKRIAMFEEIPANGLSPVTAYALLNEAYQNHGILLEDLYEDNTSRSSIICFKPLETLVIHHHDKINPLSAIRDLQLKYHYITRADVAERITSAAGFMAYDAVGFFEKIPDRHAVDSDMPTVFLNFYQLSLTFNHEKQTILVSYIVKIKNQPEAAYQHGRKKIKAVTQLLQSSFKQIPPIIKHHHVAQPDISDSDFIKLVNKAKEYIYCGEVFQVVLSRCYQREYSVSPLKIYETYREMSPSPFMFYIAMASQVIIGASPEQFIRVHHNKISVNPIAGTRKRSKTINDEIVKSDLLNDKKEIAEHSMLVDLARNDVGAVSIPGRVTVKELFNVKHYSHVSHITSTVTGELQAKYDALDAFSAAFPAGTLSGAPKIRAMELIDELETSRRGLYGGAIFRLDTMGNLDSCIAIRMATLKNGLATIRTGAGIVYDSDPVMEAQETYHKAKSLLATLAKAHGE